MNGAISPPNTTAADAGLVRILRGYAVFAGILVIGIGAAGLSGWFFHIPILVQVSAGWVSVKANTAVGLVVAGAALALAAAGRRGAFPLVRACGLVLATLGAATVLEYLFGWDLGIDQLLIAEPAGAVATTHPGQMSWVSAGNFVLCGLSLVVLVTGSNRRVWLSGALAAPIVAGSMLAILGYLFGATEFSSFSSHLTAIAVQTATAFLLLGTGIIASRNGHGILPWLTSPLFGGFMLRRLLPLAVLAPIIIIWLDGVAQKAGLLDQRSGDALSATIIVIVLAGVATWCAARVDRLDWRLAREPLNRQLAAIVEASDDAIFGKTLDGVIMNWNRGAALIYGYAPEEVVGKPVSILIPPERENEMRSSLARVRKGGHVPRSETMRRRKDGREIWVSLTLSPVRDDAGHIVAVSSTERDVTQLKRAEEARRTSEAAYQELFELSPDAIVAWRSDGVIEAANKACAMFLGYDKAEDLVGRPWTDFVVPEDLPDFGPTTRRAELTGAPFDAEFRLRRKDGSVFIAEGRLHASLDGAGNPVRTVAIARDVTERKRAESALLRLNRTLRTLSAGNMALVRAPTEQDLLNEMCRVCVESGGYRLAWIGFVEHDKAKSVRPVAWAGERSEYVQTANITWADTERGRGPSGTAIRTGEAQINPNAETNPAVAPWRADLLRHGFNSNVALPLKDGSQVFGVLDLYTGAGDSDAFGPEEIDLLEELAGDLAFGIQACRDRAGREAAAAALDQALKSTIQAVAAASEAHDAYTADHQRHVAELSVAIAREIGLTEWRIEGLFLAGLIHDVGKMNVPAEFLSKPGRLTPLQYQVIQTHVQAGYDILKGVSFPWPIAQSVLQHHERLDGSGYPNHLEGDAISIEGRILAVADVVDAMQSHRPYRPARGLVAALAEIEAGKGRLYDPAVVDACTTLFRRKGFEFH